MSEPLDPTLRPAEELATAVIAQWHCVLSGVRRIDDWGVATRIAGWTARTLLGHLVVVAEAIPRTLAEPATDDEPTDVYAVVRLPVFRSISCESARVSERTDGGG
ncbi:MAG TPA: maleylpyruvate isomerase N-terminal domain-containing protein [Solirubrobacterales bacterium]